MAGAVRQLARSIRQSTPVPFASAVNSLFNAVSGVDGPSQRQLEALGSSGTLYSSIRSLSEGTAKSEWTLYRKRTPRADPNSPRRIVTAHAALNALNKPNPHMTRFDLFEISQMHQDLTGEGIWVFDYAGTNIPINIWPVRPDRIVPVASSTEFILGWIYIAPDGERIPLHTYEVLQNKLPNPVDPYRGMGPIQSILHHLDSLKFSAEWNRQFFVNNAEPGGIIQVEDELGTVEWERLQRQWGEQHKGLSNAHRVGILENGAEWVPNSMSLKDMQFSEMFSNYREAIREALGVSKTMQGLTESVNRATAEAAVYVFQTARIDPRLGRWRNKLNTNYLNLFGANDVELDYDLELPEDEEAENAERQSKAGAAKTLRDAGYHPDDVLATVGLPPMRWVGQQIAPEANTPTPANQAMEMTRKALGGLNGS